MILALAAAALLGVGAAPGGESAWIVLDAPGEDAVVRAPAAWIELRGRAGLGDRLDHDLVILLDLSSSTLLASGADVDGDGDVGRTRGRARQLIMRNVQSTRLDRTHYSSDPDDSIRAAQAVAARRLVERLDLTRTRAALVEFDEAPRLVAPLGSPRSALLAALDTIEAEGFGRAAGTDFGAALREATRLLVGPETGSRPAPHGHRESDGHRGSDGRSRRILLLSDGHPTLPVSKRRARADALEAARAAARSGVRVDCFALGPEDHELDVFRAIAEQSGGAFHPMREAGDILEALPRVRLAGIDELRIENRTAKRPGRAQRLFADGSFDGFAPLVPGMNELRVRVAARGGPAAEITRVVSFAPLEPGDADEARRAREQVEELLELLKQRTVEAELRSELEEARRAAQRRELELRPEPP